MVICEADNYNCSAPLKEVQIKFLRHVTLLTAEGEEKNIVTEINNIAFPGVKAHDMYTG